MTDETVTAYGEARQHEVAGSVGIGMAILLAAIFVTHPPGSTELYADGVRFVEHVTPFWVVSHVLLGVILLGLPLVLGAWTKLARTAVGALFADFTAKLSIVGVTIGILHLVGTDTVTFYAFQQTLAANGEAAVLGADVLLRLHAATLVVWTLTLFSAVPLVASVSAWLDGDRRWRFWLPLTAGLLSVSAVIVTLVEQQWTTVSETILLRSGATLLLVWIFLVSWTLRHAGRSEVRTPPREPTQP